MSVQVSYYDGVINNAFITGDEYRVLVAYLKYARRLTSIDCVDVGNEVFLIEKILDDVMGINHE